MALALNECVTSKSDGPALSLQIEGSFDPSADAYALKQRLLARTVRSAIWDERRRVDTSLSSPEQLVISPADEAAMLRKLFAQKFPLGTASEGPVQTSPPPPTPAPVPEKEGFLRRVADFVTLKGLREPHPETPLVSTNLMPAQATTPATTAGTAPTLEEIKARLADAIEVSERDLRRLAAERAQFVRDYFLVQKIESERLSLANVTSEGKGARVFLQLQ